MLKKSMHLLVFFTVTFFLSSTADAATADQTQAVPSSGKKISAEQKARNDEKYEILERNQIDDTSTLAIPFDDSEVEDEEEIDELEKNNTFDLPHSH